MTSLAHLVRGVAATSTSIGRLAVAAHNGVNSADYVTASVRVACVLVCVRVYARAYTYMYTRGEKGVHDPNV